MSVDSKRVDMKTKRMTIRSSLQMRRKQINQAITMDKTGQEEQHMREDKID